MKQRGSAIVIAVFLVAAIGGLAFSFGRIFLIESRNASITENGISAYYAAESGIEEGFLRYRYDRNAEIPYGDGTATYDWKVGENMVFRSYLNVPSPITTRGTGYGGIAKTTTISSTYINQQVYDLRMGFAGTISIPLYGHNINGDEAFNTIDLLDPNYGSGKYGFLKMMRDETYKIDLSKLNFADSGINNDIRIMTKYLSPASPDPDFQKKAIMYAKLTVDYTGTGTDIREYKTIITSATAASTCVVLGRGADLSCPNELIIANSISNGDIVWHKDNLISVFESQFGTKPIVAPAKVTLSMKPLFYDAYIGLSTMQCATSLTCLNQTKTNVIPGPVTNIISTGYYSGATRTISANIDRQSGTLYDLFDYVIYQKPD